MTLLRPDGEWLRRRAALDGPLGALADGIAADLEPVLARPVRIPDEKALLSRTGGRCERDGSLLEFDPFDEHQHRCPRCDTVHDGEHHRGFWRYWYHLWLAERAVHAAVLFRLRGDPRHAQFAADVLDGYADRYLAYPNADNVLGPARVFFSTYLESIWLLQLCIALDALEGAEGGRVLPLGLRIRERIVEPCSALIAQYDEGLSNRQVWNVAALMAAARTLGRDDHLEALVNAPHGLSHLIDKGCLSDGTWYEGENYHMFAHRGLWYGVTVAEVAGARLAPATVARFDRGFIAPFLTALPDMTLPSRRDSQYAISLRQPRFAEQCELGLARVDDPRLGSALAALYQADDDVPQRENGRARTSADVERNLPAMQLRRSDLGWRALLFARETPPAVVATPMGSVLLEGQGIAVIRRDEGRLYAALDYGHPGGGHGHPDRLNLLLMHDDARWLDDLGTGSYVDRTLHWYRSTLAHNAPLVDGRSQSPATGTLLAFDDRGSAGWVHASVDDAASGVRLERIVVVMGEYLVDEVRWTADRSVTLDLPNHAPILSDGSERWERATLAGGSGLEDGFDFVTHASRRRAGAGELTTFSANREAGGELQAFVASDRDAEWWRAVAPGPPGAGDHTFHLLRVHAQTGRVRTVWSWSGEVKAVRLDDEVILTQRDGTEDRHRPILDGWRIERSGGTTHGVIDLGGRTSHVPPRPTASAPASIGVAADDIGTQAPHPVPFTATLAERDYRRSELSWAEAGCPTATVTVTAQDGSLHVRVSVTKAAPVVFVAEGQGNVLDNEPSEINGDGLQLYLRVADRAGAWTVVPVEGSVRARTLRVRGWDDFELGATSWAATPKGYEIHAAVVLAPDRPGAIAHLGVIVNETVPGRARRRGQLVLGGAEGEWIYLRGDRFERERLIPIRLPPDSLIL